MNQLLHNIGWFLVIGALFISSKVCADDLVSVEEGLSQSSVTDVYLDSKGFLWIGTQDGLNRYDGYEFRVFRHHLFDTSTISNFFIKSIDEDSRGNLWIGTANGLNRYNRKEGNFTRFYHNPKQDNSLANNLIFSVFVDSKDRVWVRCLNSLDCYDPTEDKFTHYPVDDRVANNWVIGFYSIYEDRQGKIWYGAHDGLYSLNKNELVFKVLDGCEVKSIQEKSDSTFWVTCKKGFFEVSEEGDVIREYNVQSFTHNTSSEVNFVFNDTIDNNLLIGTAEGLYTMGLNGGAMKGPVAFDLENRTLTGEYFSDLVVDAYGIQWIATLQGIIKRNKQEFKFNLLDASTIPGFDDNMIASVYEDKNNRIWGGTWNNGLYIIQQGELERHFSTYNSALSSNAIFEIIELRDGTVLIGTNNGIFNYTGNDLYAEKISNDNLLENNRIYQMYEDSTGTLWIGSAKSLLKYDRHKRRLEEIKLLADDEDASLSVKGVSSIVQDKKGNFWFGTEKGVLIYDPETKGFDHIYNYPGLTNSNLTSNQVYYLFRDSRNWIWIGTGSGINVYTNDRHLFSHYTETHGLPNDMIYAIEEDEKGKIWVSTNRGISRINPETRNIVNYNISDGLQNYEFNIGAVYKNKKGKIYFGGITGINSFYPDSIQIDTLPPPVVITSIERYTETGKRIISYGEMEELYFDEIGASFNIGFSALDFTHPSQNQYEYSLTKTYEDDEWVYLGNHRYATFSNLSPGEYIFKVRGSNNDGYWNKKGVAVKINVSAPIWETRYAILLYIAIIFLLIYGIIQYRTRTLRKLNQEYKDKERINAQIASQKEELSIQNKNIRDSITYGKRIQEAMMPPKKLFERLLPESFILHKPKDIVSGDFFWINENHDKIFVAAVDCTGHGVPGAFMSIIGFELFRKITNIEGIVEPASILNNLNEDFKEIFKDVSNITLKDGMDIAFCVIDKKRQVLEYSGAFNPLYLIRDNKISEIKGDRFSVGLDNPFQGEAKFTNHSISLEKSDVLYIFSDGYPDQFGGPEGKKFKYRRFRHLLLTIHKLPMKTQAELLDKTIEEWKGDEEQVDDILIIGFKPFT